MSDTNPVVGIMDDEIEIARHWHRRADASEARAKELEAQCAAMREALDKLRFSTPHTCHTHKHLPCGGCSAVDITSPVLSGAAGHALLERVEALERDLADKSNRCSRGAHALIELIGATGPEYIDETCARAAKRLEALERVVDVARYACNEDLDKAISAIDALESKP